MIRSLSVLVHGFSKVGKSTLGATAPKPCLIMDAEGGTKFLPFKMVEWDPEKSGPPECDDTWEICVVTVRSFNTVRLTQQWLESGQHCFRSLVVDSVSEIQGKLKATIAMESGGRFEHQQWGALLDGLDQFVKACRDLANHPINPLDVVCIIAMTKENDQGKYVPLLQGAIGPRIPYLVDICGWIEVNEYPNEDPMQPPYKVRRLIISPNPRFEAGERVQGRLGDFIDYPDLSTMLETVFPTEPVAPTQPQE